MLDGQHPTRPAPTGLEIAIIGMAGRFPGAPDIDAFWRNLRDGVESIRRFDPAALRAQGGDPALLDAPDFVAAGAPIEDFDCFDAGFFGYAPGEAELIDPQQRLFLECAWHALEDAGYGPGSGPLPVGVYASAAMNGYLRNIHGAARRRATVTPYEVFTANDKDFLASRAAWKLDLRGPAVTVQTACSSSLVAVHMAAQALLAGECAMALAGGVALSRQEGYRALQGSIFSPSGRCRAFDAGADGTVAGCGVGLVALKRLEDALADGDRIDAVIRGSAVNNDGGGKASFTAPDVAGQEAAIAAALEAAECSADSISYVEAHGAGTKLGDPIEAAALTRAFRRQTERRGYCALGSVKTNIGHLDTAAGIAGLIKTALMLRHGVLAPSLHFNRPNPQIDFAASPFAVLTARRDWRCDGPRRAGVSSFGIGGNNAHVVLEEAPPVAPSQIPPGPQLLTVSARSAEALRAGAQALAARLAQEDAPLAAAAYTLRRGRAAFRRRGAVVARDAQEAAAKLRALSPGDAAIPSAPGRAVLLFPGQGTQFAGMGRGLAAHVPAFAATMDRATRVVGSAFPDLFGNEAALAETENAQPALFALECALAQTWRAMGVAPRALLGHSVGELAAACVAGVFGFETGLELVAERGRLMQAAPRGAMLAVVHPGVALDGLLAPEIEIAAENGPGLTALSGPVGAIAEQERRCAGAGLGCKRLRSSHGFHAAAMDEAAAAFARAMARVPLAAPRLRVLSNVTGGWLSEAEATDPAYWGAQLRRTVRFGAGVATALKLEAPVFVESGPGGALGALAAAQGAAHVAPGLQPGAQALDSLLAGAGAAWAGGLSPDWSALTHEDRRRVSLPGYAFRRERHWIAPDAPDAQESAPAALDEPGAARLYAPVWRRAAPSGGATAARGRWLVFEDGGVGGGIGGGLAEALERGGADVWRAGRGDSFAESGYRRFSLPPDAEGIAALLRTLTARDAAPGRAVFLWPLDETEAGQSWSALQALATGLGETGTDTRLTVATRGAADVSGAETLDPAAAALHGLAQVAGQEHPQLGVGLIDLDPEERSPAKSVAAWLRAALLEEDAPIRARRGGRLWRLSHEAIASEPAPLRRAGVYAVIGGLAQGAGRVWAGKLAARDGARLALIEDASAPALEKDVAPQALRLSADCADAAALGDALDAVTARWGRIDGVFLSTAFSDAGTAAPLALLGASQRKAAQARGVAPLLALAGAARTRRIGFCLAQGSLSSVIGGAGLAAYAAAHHQADLALARLARGDGPRWLGLGLDAIGTEGARRAADAFALTPAMVWEATLAALASDAAGVVAVSRADLDARRARWLNPAPKPREDEAASGRRRPDLETPFVAPRNPVETEVAAILRDLLGLDRVGAEDGFFELGGHSLLAIRAVARLRDAFPVRLEMRDLLTENPSAASIARMIAAKMAEDEDLSAMLAEVSALSEEELRAALEQEGAP